MHDATTHAPEHQDDQQVLDRAHWVTAPRTLVEILRATAEEHPDAAALDDGESLSYAELLAEVDAQGAALAAAGIGPGDRVGVRVSSGGRELYLAILAVLAAGAAYVPVDADDPPERAELVFGEARVCGVITDDGYQPLRPATGSPDGLTRAPGVDDDAWIIFTSGSTGVPKGVAVTHRSAAAFVDAEAALFVREDPLGPGDRVLAGLSVAFDASCEEMWLAWRHGACLVPAPRALVRSGEDLGPWLLRRGISVVSTVPTLAALWPAETIERVRLLIFGGEACPLELAARLVGDGREVWNTYGPTEATVVACGSLLTGEAPIRIGLPLDGWQLAVVDESGHRVAPGETGELVIGGVGLARYLDPAKDAEKYAPMPSLGWDRAYRSGDLVRFEPEGLIFIGRADDQVKIGGRRIELGEVEAALGAIDGVSGCAVAVRETAAGVRILVGYVVPGPGWNRQETRARLAESLPGPLVPLLAEVEELPVRTSGKVDKAALPWPLDVAGEHGSDLTGDEAWVADQWQAVLGASVGSLDADFFDLGGGSLAAAQLVTRIRDRVPEFTVADIYEHSRLGSMVDALREALADGDLREASSYSTPSPTSRRARWAQTLLSFPLLVLTGCRWLAALLAVTSIVSLIPGFEALPTAPWPVVVVMVVVFVVPFGRMALAVALARALLVGVQPGDYQRGGVTHLRIWLAEQVQVHLAPLSAVSAPWNVAYARALGARIGRGVDLHSLPPVTGMLEIGDGAAIEPEVDLAGTWIDGDTVRVGSIRIGAGAAIGARSTLAPGTKIGPRATVAPASAVFGRVRADQHWAGSPAVRTSPAKSTLPGYEAPAPRRWFAMYVLVSIVVAAVPIVGMAAGLAVVLAAARGSGDLVEVTGWSFAMLVPAVLVAGIVIAALTVALVRLLSIGLTPGVYPVRSRVAVQAWATERLTDMARTVLFPLYASLITPVWLRLLGARVGRNVEASTVLLIPALTTIEDGAFLADDTAVATYELGGGWMRLGRVTIGARAFLGNSGMAGAGNSLPRDGLVAVLSVTPRKSKPGTSWLGSPAVRLPRVAATGDESRTYRPALRLKVARAIWEILRVSAVIVSWAIGLGVLAALAALVGGIGWWGAALVSGIVFLVAGAVAAAITTGVKWMLVGRIAVGETPLWSSFVWRNELADTFVEMVAAVWFARHASGTPALVVWLRTLGARIGRGAWVDSYWLPEADLVTLGDGATVNRGCVVQTHLFHDRIMSMDTVTLDAGATLGPHSVILPAATIGAHATVGPASLVMRGETVPVGSRWSGNPIGPWRAVKVRAYQATP